MKAHIQVNAKAAASPRMAAVNPLTRWSFRIGTLETNPDTAMKIKH